MSNLMQGTLAAAAMLAAAHAGAAEPVRYWGVHAGANTLKQWDAQVDFGFGTPVAGRADLARGVHGGLMIGRRSDNARYELEYETGRIKVERLTLDPLGAAVDAKGRYQALFVNAYRSERLGDSLDAFAGGGIGWGRVSLPLLGLGPTCNCFGPAAKSGFAWQLRAGLDYRLGPEHGIALQYTWLGLPEPQSDGPPGIRYARKRFGAVTLGYTRQF